MFLMLLACQTEPLATVELDALPELWVGVSPDNLSMLYFLSRHSWADEDCPDVVEDDTLGTQVSANDCTDDWGNTWDGDIGIFPSEGYADFESFRVQYEPQDQAGVVRDWTYDGEVTWSVSAETGELRFTVDGTIDYISTGGPLEADTQMNVQADAQLNRQVTIMDFGSGEVVLPEWGRVEWGWGGVPPWRRRQRRPAGAGLGGASRLGGAARVGTLRAMRLSPWWERARGPSRTPNRAFSSLERSKDPCRRRCQPDRVAMGACCAAAGEMPRRSRSRCRCPGGGDPPWAREGQTNPSSPAKSSSSSPNP